MRWQATISAMAAGEKLIAENRKARHEYHLLERHEAGLVLAGSEVKSLRQGGAQLRRSFADLRDGELWLVGAHIAPYEQAGAESHDPDRDRKLLLHRREIDSLTAKVQERGFTIVPTRLYFKDGRAKVELALAKGKDVRDRRREISKRDADRQIERALKQRSRR
jgi:SsrA-binding protein